MNEDSHAPLGVERHAFLVALIARLLRGRRHVAVGANLPIPAAAAVLAREQSGGRTRVEIMGSRRFGAFSNLSDLHDLATQGRLDAFFLSPGQIDGTANINLVGVGESYPRLDVRWPGSHGAPLLYMMIPNIILFRDAHRARALVAKVDFISAPGVSPPHVHRPGGPGALVTGMAHFAFERTLARFRLETIHPGVALADVEANTGFAFDRASIVESTPWPDDDAASAIEARVCEAICDVYPQFAESLALSAKALGARRPDRSEDGRR
jgi:glutaconate CoA-transferase, subunit B